MEMKKSNNSNLIENMCLQLMHVEHEFEDIIGKSMVYTKCFVSLEGNHVLILRRETENDCLVIIKKFYSGHPKESELSYFIIDEDCFEYYSKQLVSKQDILDSVIDYYLNYYPN